MKKFYQKEDYMVGVCKDGTEFLFDCEDYERIKEHYWTNHRGNIEEYGKNKKNSTLSQLICGDGINPVLRIKKVMDYRKSNLFVNNIYTEKENTYSVSTIKGVNFIIDKNDYDKIKNYRWSINTQGYPEAKIKNKRVKLHRYLLDKEVWNGYDEIIDHIDRNKLNNCRENLRITTQRENVKNSAMKSNNTSSVQNVEWNKEMGCWRASKRVEGIKYKIGNFNELHEAKIAVEKFEESLKQNTPFQNLSTYYKRKSNSNHKYIHLNTKGKYVLRIKKQYLGVFDEVDKAIDTRDKILREVSTTF